MTAVSLLAYAAALIVAVATPGPAMAALIARSVAQGARAGLGMALGIAIADVILGALALAGLAALLASYGWALTVLKYAAVAYLLWLGLRMWRSPPPPRGSNRPTDGRDLRAGVAVGLSNPKAVLFHASLMPLIVDLRLLDAASAAAIVAIIFGANVMVMSIYALTAGAGGQRLASSSGFRSMNRLAAGTMIGAAAAIAVR